MTISIKPAELIGAEIGDEVSYYDVFGDVKSGAILNIVNDSSLRLRDRSGWVRDVPLHRLVVVAKEFRVGDRVEGDDYEQLPIGTILRDLNDARVYRKDRRGDWETTGSEWNSTNLTMARDAYPREIVYLPKD